MRDKDPPPLVAAADALDTELRGLEALVASASKEPLTSQKNIERAARQLASVNELEGRLRAALSNLVEQIAGAGARQQTALEALGARAKEIEQRFEAFKSLAARRDQLGAQGAEVNEQIRVALAEGTAQAALPRAIELLGKAAQEGESLFAMAKEHEFNDLAREADSIRQHLATLKRKLSHVGGATDPEQPHGGNGTDAH